MKILTNIRFYHLAGMSQATQSFLSYFEKQDTDTIIGVNLTDTLDRNVAQITSQVPRSHIISKKIQFPMLNHVVRTCKTVEDLDEKYKDIINTYKNIIKKEKPDAIVINGTYFLPWCLYRASLNFKTKRFLHYHGILTKEIAHWKMTDRSVFEQMEKTFDRKDMFYIFPSNLAKTTVEDEVFHHKIRSNFSVIPNPIFFRPILRDAANEKKVNFKKNVGAVSRWTQIKNPQFMKKIAKLDIKYGDNFNFHMITDLPEKSKIKKGLKGILDCKPSMNHTELKKYYNHMDVILSPSFFETYGNVAQESLVHGTPALVSLNMGVAETYKKFGLDRWITDFSSPSVVYNKIHEASQCKIDYTTRRLMAAELSPNNMHAQMVSVIKQH